jgi:hypothetical protein
MISAKRAWGREGMQFPERCDQAGDARLERFIEGR